MPIAYIHSYEKKNMKRIKILLFAVGLIAFVSLSASTARAQSNAGFIRGTVADERGAVVPGATVRLTNAITDYQQTSLTDAQGVYQLVDVPFNAYTLTVEARGFANVTRTLTVKSNLAQQLNVGLSVAAVSQTVNVFADNLLEPEKTSPSVVIDRDRITTFPTAQPSRATEQLVATAPGFTLDANQRLHARGIEYQLQYSIDGIPVTDTIAATFAGSPDPRIFRSVEVTTGNVPAEYGNKLAGLIAVTTRSGLEIPKSGDVSYSVGW